MYPGVELPAYMIIAVKFTIVFVLIVVLFSSFVASAYHRGKAAILEKLNRLYQHLKSHT